MLTTILKSALVALALLVSSPAMATTLTVSTQSGGGWPFGDENGLNKWYVTSSYTIGGGTPTHSRSNIATGLFRLKGVDTTTNAIHKFGAFCLSPFEWLSLPKDYDVVTTLSIGIVNRLSALANGAWGQISNSDTAGAFQMAVWEILNEGDAGTLALGAGNFRLASTSAAALLLADGWLDKVEDGTFLKDPKGITILSATGTQNLLTRDLPDFQTPGEVPVPAAFGLLAAGLAALAGLKRARRA